MLIPNLGVRMEPIKKAKINFIIDLLAFTALLFLTSSGMLMHFVLPPGTGVQKSVWGLSRHEWGDIHLYIAFALISVIFIHLTLHWRWIVSIVKGRANSKGTLRVFTGWLVVALLVSFAAWPLLTPPEISSQGSNHEQGRFYRGGKG